MKYLHLQFLYMGVMAVTFAFVVNVTPAQAKYAALVVDYDTGEILHSVNANTRNYPASLTKIMTLYMVFEALQKGKITLSTPIKFSRRAASRPPSKLGVGWGNSITVKQAILALLTKSANDVATAVAEHLGGSEKKFARMMTNRARELGMSRSNFKNASGLPNRGQLSTARDMAVLAKRIREHFPQLYPLFATKYFVYKGRKYKNHNKLLTSFPGTEGMKTGYTNASGYNLVTIVKRKNKRLIGVIFGGKTSKMRNNQMKKILTKAFQKVGNNQVNKAPSHPDIYQINKEIRRHNDFKSPSWPAQQIKGNRIESNISTTSTAQKMTLVRHISGNGRDYADGWSVQVGAYHKLPQATKALERVLLHTSKIKKQAVVLSTNKGNRTLFRSRLVGMGRTTAMQTCRDLKRKNIGCFVISPQKAVAGG